MHPDTQHLPKIGFWSDDHDPGTYARRSQDIPRGVVDNVIAHLRGAPVTASYRGMANCRICNKPLGNKDRSDGTFVWPDQTEHYIIAHRVWTPGYQQLAEHIEGPLPEPASSTPAYGLAAATDPVSEIAIAYPQAGYALAKKIVSVASDIGANPYDLANLIAFESAYSFRSDVQNPSSKAVGLIQFTASTARKLGTTLETLASLSPVQQMDWVKAYLMRVKNGQWGDKKPGNYDNLQKLAMAVFYPWAREWSPETSFTAMGHARVPQWNPGIETPGDYLRKLQRRAKLHGDPVPQTGSEAAPGFVKRVSEAWESWWTPEDATAASATPATTPPGRRPTPPPSRTEIATWSVSPGMTLQLRAADGTAYGPGQVHPGTYTIDFWTGSQWVPVHSSTLTAGGRYHGRQDQGQLVWGKA